MDLTYNLQRTGNNRLLLTETVSVVDPFFILVMTNPWLGNTKTVTITPEGVDGEWILNLYGAIQAYQDLDAGEIYFDNTGTWTGALYLNEVTDSAFIRNILFNVIDHVIEQPTNPSATALSSSEIELHWENNSGTQIEVQRSKDQKEWTSISETSEGATGLLNAALTASTEYFYRVRAINGGQISSWSETVNATTTA